MKAHAKTGRADAAFIRARRKDHVGDGAEGSQALRVSDEIETANVDPGDAGSAARALGFLFAEPDIGTVENARKLVVGVGGDDLAGKHVRAAEEIGPGKIIGPGEA